MSYLGLDVGTTGCKAVVFDESGCQIAAAYREYPVLLPRDGWAELDPGCVCEAAMAVISEAAAQCAGDPVRALGISSQGEAFTPVDETGEMLANAMVSFDTRAAQIAADWSERFCRDRLYAATGHTAHPMFSVFKLLWLRDNCPEVWSRARSFHCFEDLIHLRLGLEPAMSWPMAGRTMMFNVRTHEWEQEILDGVGLDAGRLPRTVASGTVVGTIPPDVCVQLGLPGGVKVVAGGHDQPCGALGAGVTSPGKAMYATGTVECICPAFETAVFSDDLFLNNLCTYDFTIPGMYTTVAFCLTGGNLLQWFRDEWGQLEQEQARGTGGSAYDLLLSQMPEEPTGLLVLPYFTPSGTPYFDPQARGAIIGLRLSTTRGEVLRGLLEGVAMEMRLNLTILDRSGYPVDELYAIGGGARNRSWTQLKSDVLNRPIRTVAVTEAGCLGAAMLARAADSGDDIRDLAACWVKVTDLVEPDPRRAARYEEQFPKYIRLYPAMGKLLGS